MILGSGLSRSVVVAGRFHCPQCRSETSYEMVEYRAYFYVLYFPLVPTGSPRVRVNCLKCKGEYEESVLHRSPGAVPHPDLSPTGARQFHDASRPRLSVGKAERVLGRWDFFWYPGVVSAREGQNVRVLFDDGDEATLRADLVQELDIRVGERVFARFSGGNKYTAGVIEEMDGERILVRDDAGTREWLTVSVVRVLRGDTDHPWKVGDRVLALWPPDPLFFPGTIREIHERVFMLIAFDDGTQGNAFPNQVLPFRIEVGDLVFAPLGVKPGLSPGIVRGLEGADVLVEPPGGGPVRVPLGRLARLPPALDAEYRREHRL